MKPDDCGKLLFLGWKIDVEPAPFVDITVLLTDIFPVIGYIGEGLVIGVLCHRYGGSAQEEK